MSNYPNTYYPGQEPDDGDDEFHWMFGGGSSQSKPIKINEDSEEFQENWAVLKKTVEELTGQILSEKDTRLNMMKKINFAFKKMFDELYAMDEHIKYLEGKKKNEHPLYPSDPYRR